MTVINEGYLQLGFWAAAIIAVWKLADLAGRLLQRIFRVSERQQIAQFEKLQKELDSAVERLSRDEVRVLQPAGKGNRILRVLPEDHAYAEGLVRARILERMPEGDEGKMRAYIITEEARIALLKSNKLVH